MKKIYFTLFLLFLASKPVFSQGDQYLGEIKLCAFGFVPTGWLACNGQSVSIAQNSSLFALLGTMYGGDGVNTFKLPDYRGRAVSGAQAGTNPQGTEKGTETLTLTAANLPIHNHSESFNVNNDSATEQAPVNGSHLSSPIVQVAGSDFKGLLYNELAPDVTLNCGTTSSEGASTPISTLQPYLVMNYIIAVTGIFPYRP